MSAVSHDKKREWAKSDFSHAVLLINLLYVESRPSRIVVLVPLRRGSDGAVWYLTILHSKWLEAHAEHGYQRKRKIDRKLKKIIKNGKISKQENIW